mmetsp:Transcript_3889/g.9267  ORF Transcript_3889/g.9267 Transcript_3889/m.9267 type:complete len:160 (+) Transcript_3889:122-601(+)|eukprot:CAMPEP_0116102556 /NCGR_PEP_ID=MMETSP0327-20121206/13412_1 /TAXON_ID=44447 /ORGANISM="Pseudo-nitzschia delicatissima, Strain B596" /LENGTH=159 /DNA_ID=CAMNT_0003594603 /DNA_START=84 /DNA_END=563 /DNA_ORIENTATION=-
MPEAETTTTDAPPSSKAKLVHWQEVQDTVSRLASHKGVLAISILNSNGDIVTQQITSAGSARKNSSDNWGESSSGVLGNPKLLTEMMKNANTYVQSLPGHDTADGDDETTESEDGLPTTKKSNENISFVRIRTRKDEILVAPKLGYTLVVLQDPSLSSL